MCQSVFNSSKKLEGCRLSRTVAPHQQPAQTSAAHPLLPLSPLTALAWHYRAEVIPAPCPPSQIPPIRLSVFSAAPASHASAHRIAAATPPHAARRHRPPHAATLLFFLPCERELGAVEMRLPGEQVLRRGSAWQRKVLTEDEGLEGEEPGAAAALLI